MMRQVVATVVLVALAMLALHVSPVTLPPVDRGLPAWDHASGHRP